MRDQELGLVLSFQKFLIMIPRIIGRWVGVGRTREVKGEVLYVNWLLRVDCGDVGPV